MLLSMGQVGHAQTVSSTLGLAIEDADFTVAKTTAEIRISLVFTLGISQTQVLQSFAILQSIVTEWKNSSCFEGTSPLKDQLYEALDPGYKNLENLKTKYLRFYSYVQEGIKTPGATCILENKMFNDLILTEEPKQLVSLRTGFALTGTAAEVWAKKDVVRAAAEFSMAYNALFASLSSEIDEELSYLSLLTELSFPQNLRGSLETLSCLSNTNADFEKIEVLHCKKSTSKFICEITVSEPATVTTYMKLIPIVYEDVHINIPANSFLVKDSGTNKLIILNCDDDQLTLPTCTVSDKHVSCTTSLQEHDIDASIAACSFSYGKQNNFAMRLGNEAILIHGNYLSVLDGSTTVIQRPPLLIYSNNEVKISSLQEEITFKPTVTVANPRIEITKVTGGQVAAMKVKAYWSKLWDYVISSEFLNYISLGLEIIFAPLTLVGLCLGCRKGTGYGKRQAKMVRKQSRKDNYKQNMALLQNRSSRSSRR
jgi:hypothetical protein